MKINEQSHIVVLSNAGGTGKSTTLEALRQALSRVGTVDIVDLDPQKTLTHTYKLTKKKRPLDPSEVKEGDFVIYDTPPFFFEYEKSLLKNCDIILIPFKVGRKDLVAFRPLFDLLQETKTLTKACVFINEARKPHTNLFKYLRKLFLEIYDGVFLCENELSRLDSFADILYSDMTEKALGQFLNILKEISEKKNVPQTIKKSFIEASKICYDKNRNK